MELKGKGSDKQGEICNIIKTKLVLQAKSWCALLLASPDPSL
jgi:hypothetical protein